MINVSQAIPTLKEKTEGGRFTRSRPTDSFINFKNRSSHPTNNQIRHAFNARLHKYNQIEKPFLNKYLLTPTIARYN